MIVATTRLPANADWSGVNITVCTQLSVNCRQLNVFAPGIFQLYL
jgi:hypothetical protein